MLNLNLLECQFHRFVTTYNMGSNELVSDCGFSGSTDYTPLGLNDMMHTISFY